MCSKHMEFIKKTYNCELCNYSTQSLTDYKKHERTKKHITKNLKFIENNPYSKYKYVCHNCKYGTDNLSNYNRHIKTPKHLNKGNKNSHDDYKYICICGISYKNGQSLSRHKKGCEEYIELKEIQINKNQKEFIKILKKKYNTDENFSGLNSCSQSNSSLHSNLGSESTSTETESNIGSDSGSVSDLSSGSETECELLDKKEEKNIPDGMVSNEKYNSLVKKLIESRTMVCDAEDKIADTEKKLAETQEQNSKLIDVVSQQQDKINDIIPMIGNNNNNNTTNNVSINVFLNENCKDAINLMDFVKSIKLQLSDLERNAEIGYVDSLSNLLIEGLNQMKVTDRPIHCTDSKRDVLYVKDNDAWEKEDSSHDKMSRAVNKLSFSNSKLLGEWVNANPNYSNLDTPEHAKYMNMITSVSPDDEEKKVKQVIKNVAKAVVLDRDNLKEQK